ncbi:DUF3800 domain-containing protein [Chloroflexota bacterium]
MKRYRLYIDESGDHTYYKLEEPAKRYLGLTGVFIESEYYRMTFQPEMERLKQEHFPHSPDEPIILHREDLVNRRGLFWRLRDTEREQAFNRDILQFMKEQDYHIVTVVIDKDAHIKRYGDAAHHPYHYCLTVLLERYCGFLNFHNLQGDVLAESRGGTEDKQLKRAYQRLYRDGTGHRDSKFFQQALTSFEIKLKPKFKNIAGLQLSDLLAHPSKQEILIEEKRLDNRADNFGRQICQNIQTRYNRHLYDGRIKGYGKVFLD